ncbi:MAG TPA: rhodanese-like domain-containing protein [Propionibacterium sp.]|jgi:rhodanese-related sulfurtransferase|nr:rhodanese-like domain-containing protein [Propionibacterium sp.]
MTPRKPGTPLAKSSAALVAEANALIDCISQAEATALLDNPRILLVDIRDPRELEREGVIPGAFRAPRGMLEFWVDPESPYFKPALDDGRRLVLYCGSGWRSALAARSLKEMGRTDVAHLEGGFSAWKRAGRPVEPAPGKGTGRG